MFFVLFDPFFDFGIWFVEKYVERCVEDELFTLRNIRLEVIELCCLVCDGI